MLLVSVSIVAASGHPLSTMMTEGDEGMAMDVDIDENNNSSAQMFATFNEMIANMQYQNHWDGVLNVQCNRGDGFYKVRSKHDNGREDRLWEFRCRNVVQCGSSPTCSKTGYINNFRQTILFQCGANKYMAGVYSYHDNSKEDRRWVFTCCSAPSYITSECRLTNYMNSLDQQMNFIAQTGEVITGAFSYYSTGTRYKFMLRNVLSKIISELGLSCMYNIMVS